MAVVLSLGCKCDEDVLNDPFFPGNLYVSVPVSGRQRCVSVRVLGLTTGRSKMWRFHFLVGSYLWVNNVCRFTFVGPHCVSVVSIPGRKCVPAPICRSAMYVGSQLLVNNVWQLLFPEQLCIIGSYLMINNVHMRLFPDPQCVNGSYLFVDVMKDVPRILFFPSHSWSQICVGSYVGRQYVHSYLLAEGARRCLLLDRSMAYVLNTDVCQLLFRVRQSVPLIILAIMYVGLRTHFRPNASSQFDVYR